MMPATTSATPTVDPAAHLDPARREAAQRDAALQRLSYLFRRAGSDITMQALLRAMVDYRTEKSPCSR